MKRLTVLTAALAAGMMTFAANAETREALEEKAAAARLAKVDAVTTSSIAKPDEVKSPGKKPSAGKASQSPRAGKSSQAAKSSASAKATVAAAKSGGASPYSQIITKYASQHGIPVALAKAVVRIESNFRPNARGSAGEIGLMQIKPATARMMGYSGSVKGLYDPDTNIRYGMKYLAMAHQLGGGDTCGTILRYNAGHAATRMNKISAAYCAKVKRHMAGA